VSYVAESAARSWCWLIHLQTADARYWICMAYYQNTPHSDAQNTTVIQYDYDELLTTHLDSTTIGAAPRGV
jgi:hypothetical protein